MRGSAVECMSCWWLDVGDRNGGLDSLFKPNLRALTGRRLNRPFAKVSCLIVLSGRYTGSCSWETSVMAEYSREDGTNEKIEVDRVAESRQQQGYDGLKKISLYFNEDM